MAELLDPTLGCVFNTIFGQENSKPLLLSFLNALLKGKPQITDMTLETDVKKSLEVCEESLFEMRATSNHKIDIGIDIPYKNTGDIPERAIHSLSTIIDRHMRIYGVYGKYQAVGIWILRESVTQREGVIQEACLMYHQKDADPLLMTDDIRIILIEMPKFDPKKADPEKPLTAWLSFLKDPAHMDKQFLKIDEIGAAMDTLQSISADDAFRAIADAQQKAIDDYNASLEA
ncbi:MAG: Rpn family recombination-promoting nuclease/putative transposase [Holosporales bacterium]|jgi:predicted transposase/invertase (TIGR01784 family)|nr:Rpn family recombination-promoting nuclease/putative transposase [Holosporales bacterium]